MMTMRITTAYKMRQPRMRGREQNESAFFFFSVLRKTLMCFTFLIVSAISERPSSTSCGVTRVICKQFWSDADISVFFFGK